MTTLYGRELDGHTGYENFEVDLNGTHIKCMCTHAALSILGRSRGKSLCNHNPYDVEEKLVAKYCSVAHRYALSCHYSA